MTGPTPSMRKTASSFTPLTAAEARHRVRRRRGLQSVVVLCAAVGLVVIVGLRLDRSEGVTMTAGAPEATRTTSGTGTTPGSTPGTSPGTTVAAPLPLPPPGTDPTTTTTSAPMVIDATSTTAVTTASTPPDGSIHLTGTYRTANQLLFATPLCPDQEHRRDGTYTFSDGSTWQYHTVFCATIDEHNVWLGIGDYTLTGPDGAVLSGDFHNRAQLPTYGVPYPMRITSGTSAYAGVTGSCVVDVHLIDGAFGKVDDPSQPGTFTCDVTNWPTTTPAAS